MTFDLALLHADARRIPLADETVQCVVTSPPYWGLRKYKGAQELIWQAGLSGANQENECPHEWAEETKPGISGGLNGDATVAPYEPNRFVPPTVSGICFMCGAWRGAYGLEPTVEMYVAHTVEILREIRRVLRKDGVVFWNVGDSYAAHRDSKQTADSLRKGKWNVPAGTATDFSGNRNPQTLRDSGIKSKDLCLIPARVALAAQADVSVRNGVKEAWWVRSLIIWSKPNPMPESVTNRPTDAYEHIILLTKSERYFWDQEAVKEKGGDGSDRWGGPTMKLDTEKSFGGASVNGNAQNRPMRTFEYNGTRNLRNVWEFPTQPYSGAHFATFPEEIPRRAILAGTSAKGACAKCAAPWRRIVEPSPEYAKVLEANESKLYGKPDNVREFSGQTPDVCAEYLTIGWEPTCKCGADETVPCLVLDPFGGSGTTGRVAVELNRRAVLLDLAYTPDAYAPLARERTTEVQREMFG